MKRLVLIFALAAAVAGAQTSSDSDVIAKIRTEGLQHSQAMDTLFWLSDALGPRLTGSPEVAAAGQWTLQRLRSYGLKNVHEERWAFDGKGWSLEAFHASMRAGDQPQIMPLIGYPKAWSGSTNGDVTAEVIRPQINSAADFAKYAGQLRGKIVLTQPAREVRMLEGPIILRYGPKEIQEMMTPDQPRAARGGRGGAGTGRGAAAAQFRTQLMRFYEDQGVVALFDRGGNSDMASGGSNLSWQQQHTDGGTVFVQGVTPRDGTALPQVTLAVEHYNRMARLVDHNIPVTVNLEVRARFTDQPRGGGGFNIVGEIPGSDLASQVVMLGAHFDSWQGATGATDNGTGSTAMIEAMRILQTLGLKPRRTIRIGLWCGEEEGELGSKAYVAAHRADMDKLAAYYNLDNGTGKIRGVWMQDNTAVAPIFKAWGAQLADLGVDLFSPRAVQQTDHTSFDAAGVPAFQFVQERLEYNSRTHHSNMDFYDHAIPADLQQQATVAAVFAWLTAERDEPLPRKAAAAGAENQN